MINLIKKILKKFIRTREVKEKVIIPTIKGEYLKDRCALITGSSAGIGYSIAESFLNNGASVIIVGRDENKLNKAKASLLYDTNCSSDKIFSHVLDISDVKNLKVNFENIVKECNKPIDIFVNNAGINIGDYFPDTSEEDYDKVLDTNLKGTYFFSQIVCDYMVNNKIKGNLLNVLSSSSLRPGISPYIISKWGERSLTLGLAKKYLPYGIIVNAVAPGSTSTSMVNHGELNDLNCEYTLTERFVAPEEVANIATILVSNIGRMIIGDTIYITGGAGLLTYDDMKY